MKSRGEVSHLLQRGQGFYYLDCFYTYLHDAARPLRIPGNRENRWSRLRRAAGFAPGQWVPDVCRHTFASYHAAYFQDLGALQLEMGHRSAHLLLSRYLNLPQVKQARAYLNRC